jgi:hypothetical protein
MIEAHPVKVGGKRLRQTPTWRMVASVLAGTLGRASTSRSAQETASIAGRPKAFGGSSPAMMRQAKRSFSPSKKNSLPVTTSYISRFLFRFDHLSCVDV